MSTASLDHLDAQQLRALAERLMGEVATRDVQIAAHDAVIAERDRVLRFKQTHIDQLTQELALYKRWRYGKRSEQLDPAQASLRCRKRRAACGCRRSCRAPTSTTSRRPRRAAAAVA